MNLPSSFLLRPLAHRALHDLKKGRAENSPAAISAAIEAGYGIEIDVQLSKDGKAMVFHDYDMKRLTGQKGPIQQQNSADLKRITLTGTTDTIPSLKQVLDQVAGRAPLLIEIKDQDGGLGAAVGRLEQAVADDLRNYTGDVAVMSFNPHSVRVFGGMASDVPRGLTTCAFKRTDWWPVPVATLKRLASLPDIVPSGACFISHDVDDLHNPRVAELKSRGIPILCWTVQSESQEMKVRQIADNITFEGYTAALPT